MLNAIHFDLDIISYFLLVVYRPPHLTVTSIDLFIENLQDCLATVVKRNVRVLVVGDFDIDMAVDDRYLKQLWPCCYRLDWEGQFFPYTRSLIDNIFCIVPSTIAKYELVISIISDYHAQVMNITSSAPLSTCSLKLSVNILFNDLKIRIFKCLLRNNKWDSFYALMK